MQTWSWMQAGERSELHSKLTKLKKAGLTGVIMQGKPADIAFAAKLGKEIGIEVHYWFVAMSCRDAKAASNPDWFCLNAKGESSLTNPPYVNYYQWLCPNHPEVIPYLKNRMDIFLNIPELNGIQLDYIRFPDVILPNKLQPHYNLVQDHIMPEYDYCYCPKCREKFKEQHGQDPLDLDDIAQNPDWLEFRLQSINKVVQQLTEHVHAAGKMISAAVFPTPNMSAEMVRQRWSDWNLDAYYPMLYHNFYTGKIDWIKECLKDINSTISTRAPVFAGLYLKGFKGDDLEKALSENREFCAGYSFFEFGGLNEKTLEIIEKMS